mmetsp:Transcript_12518/g.26662  ORF Transcript_12518/g.26662 Transcript_12518/m.26662 type:complete len:527 (-) Transcript_12518:30-1610(-)
MKFYPILCIFLGSPTATVSSYLTPSQQHVVTKPSSSIKASRFAKKATHSSTFGLRASSALSGGSDDTDDDVSDGSIVLSSIAVGGITAAAGFLYGKVLGLTLKTVWSTIPSIILEKVGSINPAFFITGVCTFGGLLMGILSSKLQDTFTVADFVSAFSTAPVESLPSSTKHLLPLLLLSLVTSTFGFSVGPEAPMVCTGALIGSSLSRRMYGSSMKSQEILSYAGAAGALTAFMGIPIAGSIFALELTRPGSRIESTALSPAVISSIAAIALIRGFLAPSASVGGHFSYGPIGDLSGRAMILTSLACGVGGGFLGTCFHKIVHKMKKLSWNTKDKSESPWKRQMLVKTVIGVIVGIISTNYPQTLFWGEGSLQTVVDGHRTAFSATKHGLSDALTSAARVNPSIPFASPAAALQVGAAKFISIALACAGKFPGGIIFPLFFAAAPFAHACSSFVGPNLMPVAVMCLMAATQASVTRTPLATAFILTLSASQTTELSVMLPACLISSYLGVFSSRELSKKSYFSYND